MNDQPEIIPASNPDDLTARSSATINAASYLLESLVHIIDPQTRIALNRMMDANTTLVGLLVIFGKGGVMPRLQMVATDADGASPVVVAEVHRGSVRHTNALH